MKTVRYNTFETNSSSCHTLTVTAKVNEINEFNEGKRIYADLRSSDTAILKEEGFHTFEDVANALMETLGTNKYDELENSDSDSPLYDAQNVLNNSPWSDETKQEFDELKEWMSTHFNADMMEWAFTNKKNPDYPPFKSTIRNFIRAWANRVWIGPLLTIYDLRKDDGRATSSMMDGSQVFWEKPGIFVPKVEGYDNYKVAVDFRD